MNETALRLLLRELCGLPTETEWVEFKVNNTNPEEIGEYLSAIANSAALLGRERGYLVWGVEDVSHRVVGTNFQPRQAKKGNEELENWLGRLLDPRLDFRIHEFDHEGHRIVLFEVPAADRTPVRFQGTEFIRVGSYKKKLHDFPEKERRLWAIFRRETFEQGIAKSRVSSDEVLHLIDYPEFFERFAISLPDNRVGILDRLRLERVIEDSGDGTFDVTNLGAVLFARRLDDFDRLARKAPRIIQYRDRDRLDTIREQGSSKGYAVAFDGLVDSINDLLPSNEVIGDAFRREVRMYPKLAVRELVANMLIHQDFSLTGTGPMVEIFTDRIEFTNPGTPLIDPLRFIDEPPRSRNETLAGVLRRLNICEERGTGIDKVITQIELFQLPPPLVLVTSQHTKVFLYAPRKFAEMTPEERVRACYHHACLCWVTGKSMTNATVRERFGIEEQNYSTASRIIGEAIKEGLVRRVDPKNRSNKHIKYVPFWL
jgi:predicted HTH transcriptional regulator